MLANDFRAKLIMMKRILASVALLFAALAVTAAPAGADPSPFGALGCSCQSVSGVPAGTPDVKDQVDQGIQNGLASLHRPHGS
jgi:hypothetical protein